MKKVRQIDLRTDPIKTRRRRPEGGAKSRKRDGDKKTPKGNPKAAPLDARRRSQTTSKQIDVPRHRGRAGE